jgi:HTH-type transcriptional regulator/antitoxin HipB
MTLKEIRQRKGVTQAEMAKHLGITRQAYNHCENHPEGITVERANRICNFLGVTYDDIFLPRVDS